MGHVVWFAGQKPQRRTRLMETLRAARFHYARCLFGASYGMQAVGA